MTTLLWSSGQEPSSEQVQAPGKLLHPRLSREACYGTPRQVDLLLLLQHRHVAGYFLGELAMSLVTNSRTLDHRSEA